MFALLRASNQKGSARAQEINNLPLEKAVGDVIVNKSGFPETDRSTKCPNVK